LRDYRLKTGPSLGSPPLLEDVTRGTLAGPGASAGGGAFSPFRDMLEPLLLTLSLPLVIRCGLNGQSLTLPLSSILLLMLV